MIKFKEILNEEQDQDRLLDLLKKKYKVTNPLLIRGSNDEIDDFEEKKIRKDRTPVDTLPMTHELVNGIEDGYFQKYPKRKESKFAVTHYEKSSARQFGDYLYYTFPHKNAKIASLDQDAITYFDSLFKYDRKVLEKIDERNAPCFMELIAAYIHGNQNKFYSLGKNSWDCISRESQTVEDDKLVSYDGDEDYHNAKNVINMFRQYIRHINNYFEDLTLGIERHSTEVIFDGPEYLVVELSFFERNFNYRNGSLSKKR